MVKVIVGMMGSSVAKGSTSLSTAAQVSEFLAAVRAHNITDLDTARVYNKGRSEELLGEVHAPSTFTISTKAPAFTPGSLAPDKISANCNASLAALGVTKVDIYYLHGPDRATPLHDQCSAIARLYTEGKFARFGLSNISAAEVREVHDICAREGWVRPSVYQGGYSPLQRGAEEELFPVLRELGMVFYAFSPLAGGALAKPIEEVMRPREGERFSEMPVFGDMFLKPVVVEELRKLTRLCAEEGVGVMEATVRWFLHHSPLGEEDGMILGASSTRQIEASLSATEKGRLPQALVEEYERLWRAIRDPPAEQL